MNEKLLYFKSWIATKYINLLGNKDADFKSILVFKLDEIGDLVTSLHVFYNLHNEYPKVIIHVVCKKFNFPFFKHLNYVKCIENTSELEKHYDLIVDLRGNQDALQYSLNNRPLYRLDRGSIRLKNKFFGGQKNEIDTNLEIIKPLLKSEGITKNKIELSPEEHQKVATFIREENLSNFAIIHLGARDESRRWPIERFAACINYINTKYEMPCVLVGGADDNELNIKCLSLVKSKYNYNVVGMFNLLEFAALCERSTLFIGNESGPLHIAAAQNTPNIALFGPGVRNVFYPKNDKSIVHHYFLARGHKKQTIENTTINSIAVNEVKQSVDKLLS